MTPIVSHTLVGVCCFLLGCAVGWIARLKVSKKENPQISLKKWNLSIGIGLIVLSIVSLIGVMIGIKSYALATECQANYNRIFSSAIKERADASNKERAFQLRLTQATLGMLDIITDSKSTPDQRLAAVNSWRRAYDAYLVYLNQANQTRDANPIPSVPNCNDGV